MAFARQVTVDTTSFEDSIEQGFRDIARLKSLVGMSTRTKKARISKFNRAYGASRDKNRLTLSAARRSSYGSMYFDPFPSQMRAIMRYNESVRLVAPAAGSFTATYFRANSIFDPAAGFGGHQSYGHDTYQSIYNHYRVDKAVCRVTFGTSATAALIGLALQDDQTTAGTIDSIFEQKGVRKTVIGSSVEYPTQTLTLTYNRLKTFVSNESNIQANFGSNPTEQQFFTIYNRALEAVATPTSTLVFVSIDYYVTMWEPRDLGTS